MRVPRAWRQKAGRRLAVEALEERALLSSGLATARLVKDINTARFGAKGRYDRLAFVSVFSGGKPRAQVPVSLIGDRLVVLDVPTKSSSDESTLVGDRFAFLQRSVADAYLVQTDLFKQINAPVGELCMASLHVADAAAKSGDATGDAEFATVSAEIAEMTARGHPRRVGLMGPE